MENPNYYIIVCAVDGDDEYPSSLIMVEAQTRLEGHNYAKDQYRTLHDIPMHKKINSNKIIVTKDPEYADNCYNALIEGEKTIERSSNSGSSGEPSAMGDSMA